MTTAVQLVSSFTPASCLFDSVCSSAAAVVTSLEYSLMALSSSQYPWARSMAVFACCRTSATLAQWAPSVDRIVDMLASRKSLADLTSTADGASSSMAGETSGRMDSSLSRCCIISAPLCSMASKACSMDSRRSRSRCLVLKKSTVRNWADSIALNPVTANATAPGPDTLVIAPRAGDDPRDPTVT